MLFLVSAGNYLTLFVGWEGIGIVSYLLINYYFTRIQANKSAMLALIMNRFGDFGLSIAFFCYICIIWIFKLCYNIFTSSLYEWYSYYYY